MPIPGRILDLSGAKPALDQDGHRLFRQPRKRSTDLPPGFLAGVAGGGGNSSGFSAAKFNRLTLDFLASSRSADQDLFGDNIRLRARARKLAIDNPFARKFLQMVAQNVVGTSGILMQAKVRNEHGRETADTKRINGRIEQEWARWCRMGRCTADGRFSFLGVQLLAIKNWAREGENIVRLVFGRQFNDSAFALQLLDNDQLDDSLMQVTATDGGEIRMGVEVDVYRRPVAYHLWNGHPNDPLARGTRVRTRIPAAEIVHTAMWERPGQTRGYTQMCAAILPLNQYNRYEEAVVVAARASAAKFAVIEQAAAEGYNPDDEDGQGNGRNADGTALMTANAGEIPVLSPGETLNFTDPRFPTNTHKEFTVTMLRNVASALLVSYPSLANDLEGVNFSSIRAGLLDERDCWRIVQRWFIETFLEPVFAAWLRMAQLTVLADVTLTAAQREQITWKPRGWDWVDPLKDAQAIVLKLQNGLITYADALAALGLDFEETITERAAEQAFLEALGIHLGTDIRGQADTATDDTMHAGGEQGAAADGKDNSGKAAAAAKPKRTTDLERLALARELFRQLREEA